MVSLRNVPSGTSLTVRMLVVLQLKQIINTGSNQEHHSLTIFLGHFGFVRQHSQEKFHSHCSYVIFPKKLDFLVLFLRFSGTELWTDEHIHMHINIHEVLCFNRAEHVQV